MLKDGLLQILDKVHQRKAFDFRGYKESTLKRRVGRRLRATKTESYQQYTEVLDADPGEYTRLIDNLTIQVTEFFRNPEAWQILREEVIPKIIDEKRSSEIMNKSSRPRLRIWSAGCATGQEVYSVAILVDQLLGKEKNDFEVEIWGTDIDAESILKAEQAEYKPDMVKTVPQDILNTYFDRPGNFRMKPRIMNSVSFKRHDLVLDSPLEQIDLIVCRNVAIYFTRPLQMKIFTDFCNGLKTGGYLFLGKAETLVGPAKEKFGIINKRWKIYQKIYN